MEKKDGREWKPETGMTREVPTEGKERKEEDQWSISNRQKFHVPEMEVLNLTRLFQGLGYLHFYVPNEMSWWNRVLINVIKIEVMTEHTLDLPLHVTAESEGLKGFATKTGGDCYNRIHVWYILGPA